MYTLDSLIAINTSYHHEHRVTPSDLEMVNSFVARIEDRRELLPPVVTEGDLIIYAKPDGSIVSDKGHLEHGYDETVPFVICTDPYVPFINERLVCDTSGGYWVAVHPEDIPTFVYGGRVEKMFTAWGHCGRCGNGAVEFKASVHQWTFTNEHFY